MTGQADGWTGRAGQFITEALSLIDSEDVIPQLSAAIQCLRVGAGEADPSTMDGYPFPGDDDEDSPPCTCPPDLAAHGGFASTCPAHGGPLW